MNSQSINCLVDGEFKDIKSCDLLVGDIIKVKKDTEIPADIVLLSTSEPDNTAYIDSSNFDGETK